MFQKIWKWMFPPCKTHLWEVKDRWYDGQGGFTVKLKCNKCRLEDYKTYKE